MYPAFVPILLLSFLTAEPPAAPAAEAPPARPVNAAGGPTLVLPLRSVGVSDTTLAVSRDLLEGSLEDLGVQVLRAGGLASGLPSGAEACDDPECAAALGRQHQAAQVVYGSFSRLGRKVIVRLNVVRVGEPAPCYRDQLTSATESDLDRVMRRFAEGIAAGRPNSDRATVDSVTLWEAHEPPRRATRSGPGFSAGFLFPAGSSYTGADRLTNFHFAYKYETRDFFIETTPLLGFTWGEGNIDWAILDLSVCRIFGTGDFAPYAGAGFGVHSVRLEKEMLVHYEYPGGSSDYMETTAQAETVPSLDLVAGILAFRTFDFEIVTELRYHHVFEDFEKVGGNGARGVRLTFGTSR